MNTTCISVSMLYTRNTHPWTWGVRAAWLLPPHQTTETTQGWGVRQQREDDLITHSWSSDDHLQHPITLRCVIPLCCLGSNTPRVC